MLVFSNSILVLLDPARNEHALLAGLPLNSKAAVSAASSPELVDVGRPVFMLLPGTSLLRCPMPADLQDAILRTLPWVGNTESDSDSRSTASSRPGSQERVGGETRKRSRDEASAERAVARKLLESLRELIDKSSTAKRRLRAATHPDGLPAETKASGKLVRDILNL